MQLLMSQQSVLVMNIQYTFVSPQRAHDSKILRKDDCFSITAQPIIYEIGFCKMDIREQWSEMYAHHSIIRL